MNNLSVENKTYTTFDISLTAVLLTYGFELESIDKANPRKVQFIFLRKDTLDEIVTKYWSKELVVEPQSLLSNLKMLKNRIYSTEI